MAYAIKKGSQYFNTVLWSGDGGTQNITGLEFSPDLVWVKSRTDGGSHSLQDSVRGVGSATKLSTNSTNAENNSSADATDPIYGYLTSINSDGFTAYAGTTPSQVNKSGQNYVGWTWKGGESTVENTDGTITSQVSANPTSGFSVITFTGNGTAGATIGHGLGAVPKFIVVKNRTYGVNWRVYHASQGATKFLSLNLSNAVGTSSLEWNNTTPTSSVITVGTSDNINRSGDNIVMYAFAEVDGFSKIGSYTGNGSADGTFVYTGFRPAFVLVKTTSDAAGWRITDTSRDTYNVSDERLQPNSSAAADTISNIMDVLSNGFKLRNTDASWNTSGQTYIYMAFAETPMKFANAR